MYKGLLRPSPFVLPYWSPGCMRRICFDVLQGHCMVIGVKSVRWAKDQVADLESKLFLRK